jgi:hypothetical protein
MATWAPFSVYTMLHSERLAQQHEEGAAHTLREGKRWVTAARLWRESTREQLPMPIIFSAAEADKGLIYWGVVDSIAVDDDGTTCTYADLRPIEPAKPLSTLRLRSHGRPMSDENIRPYAICHTPNFVV